MGELIGGEWRVNGIETVTASGRLERPPSAFRDWVTADGSAAPGGDYYPAEHRQEIDAVNSRIYRGLNNGVYMAGFATDRSAYEDAFAGVFDTLDWLEARLSHRRFLVGATLTEPTSGCSPRWCASTQSTTGTSSAIGRR